MATKRAHFKTECILLSKIILLAQTFFVYSQTKNF